jgi:hypothetical protein
VLRAALAGILTLSSVSANASSGSPSITVSDTDSKKQDPPGKNQKKTTGTKKPILLKGRVISKKDKGAISQVIVAIKGSTSRAITDEKGKFTIELPDTFKEEKVILTFSSGEYEYFQKEYPRKQLPKSEILIQLSAYEHFIMGDIAPE